MAKTEIVQNAARAENLLDFEDSDIENEDEGTPEFQDAETNEDDVKNPTANANQILDELSDLFAGMSTQTPAQKAGNKGPQKNNDILGPF